MGLYVTGQVDHLSTLCLLQHESPPYLLLGKIYFSAKGITGKYDIIRKKNMTIISFLIAECSFLHFLINWSTRPAHNHGPSSHFIRLDVRPSVPTFQNLAKQNHVKTMFTTAETVGLAEWIILTFPRKSIL